jgi:hypothetical protein
VHHAITKQSLKMLTRHMTDGCTYYFCTIEVGSCFFLTENFKKCMSEDGHQVSYDLQEGRDCLISFSFVLFLIDLRLMASFVTLQPLN